MSAGTDLGGGGDTGLDTTVTDTAVVATGSNIGNRTEALALLRAHLLRDGVLIEQASAEILTLPVGVTGQAAFHNQVLRLRAPLLWSARAWLDHCRRAEIEAGRKHTYHWGPRRADVDILLLGRSGEVRVHTPQLTVPHPEIHNRPFIRRLLEQLGIQAPQ